MVLTDVIFSENILFFLIIQFYKSGEDEEPVFGTKGLKQFQVNVCSFFQLLHYEKVYQHKRTSEESLLESYSTEISMTYIVWHYHFSIHIPKYWIEFSLQSKILSTKYTKVRKYFRTILYKIYQNHSRKIIYKVNKILKPYFRQNMTMPQTIEWSNSKADSVYLLPLSPGKLMFRKSTWLAI